MLDEFFIRALLAAAGVALVAAPLGCFVVWRRMAYFGDTMAHSALLGIGLGLFFEISITAGVIAVAFSVSLLLVALQTRTDVATDTLLGILSHSTLSLGLVIVGLVRWGQGDLLGYLFGDVLAVSWQDVVLVWVSCGLTLGVLAAIWRALLANTVSEDLARAEGIGGLRYRIVFMAMMALVIAISMQIIGVLLITSLLVIPAATARAFSRTPEQMAVFAAAAGVLAAISGLFTSLVLDTPSGPSIVIAAAFLFAVSVAARTGGRLLVNASFSSNRT